MLMNRVDRLLQIHPFITEPPFNTQLKLGNLSTPLQDVLMTLSGKTPTLFRHDLSGLHSKQADRLTISMNAMHKIPSKFVPKKFAMTAKVPNTKGTTKVGVKTLIVTQQTILMSWSQSTL